MCGFDIPTQSRKRPRKSAVETEPTEAKAEEAVEAVEEAEEAVEAEAAAVAPHSKSPEKIQIPRIILQKLLKKR